MQRFEPVFKSKYWDCKTANINLFFWKKVLKILEMIFMGWDDLMFSPSSGSCSIFTLLSFQQQQQQQQQLEKFFWNTLLKKKNIQNTLWKNTFKIYFFCFWKKKYTSHVPSSPLCLFNSSNSLRGTREPSTWSARAKAKTFTTPILQYQV